MKKDTNQFPEGGLILKNNRIIIGKCCNCGFRHAWYFEVWRGKERKDDEIYIQCEVVNDKLKYGKFKRKPKKKK